MAMPQHPPFKPAPEITHDPRDWVVDPEQVLAEENWALHMVFTQVGEFTAEDAAALDAAVRATGVEIRGWYDVAGFRADADLMCWVLGKSAEECQAAYRAVASQGAFEPVWSAMSRHMAAEFNRIHLAACFGGFAARKYLAVYPFVRSWDWYYLPEGRRSAILREHGANGREFNDVPVSTLAAFALGDWEWTVSLEGDSLDRVMAVLRRQREAEARLFVRLDTPFYTGVRMELAEWVALRS